LGRPLRFSRAGGFFFILLGLLGLLASSWTQPAPTNPNPSRFESEIQALEAQEAAHPLPAAPIVFVGSSSFRLWKDLSDALAGFPVVNHGFGGSHLSDIRHFLDRLVLRHHPSRVVMYAGDNDLAAGKSPETVLADFQSLVTEIRKELGPVPVDFVTIKPSPSRLALLHDQKRANRLVTDYCASAPGLSVIDIWTPMIDRQGAPREELFQSDRLHLNAEGYRIWTDVFRRHLESVPPKR
jgi:lysophospholipase L1-like esterase